MAAPSPLAHKFSGVAFGLIFAVAAALIFYLIWIVDSPSGAFGALLTIGFVALVFGLIAFVAEALTSNPTILRASSWGFLAMGFVVIFLTLGFSMNPPPLLERVVIALVALVFLAVAVGGFYWRSGKRLTEASQMAARQSWQARPAASAFDYKAANPPNVPPPRAPPPSGGS